jgi:hypothetical protein
MAYDTFPALADRKGQPACADCPSCSLRCYAHNLLSVDLTLCYAVLKNTWPAITSVCTMLAAQYGGVTML